MQNFILQKSLETVQIVGLGMLVDLCEDESVVPYILTWRKDGRRYINLLLDIIRKENKRLKVKIGKSGVIKGNDHCKNNTCNKIFANLTEIIRTIYHIPNSSNKIFFKSLQISIIH